MCANSAKNKEQQLTKNWNNKLTREEDLHTRLGFPGRYLDKMGPDLHGFWWRAWGPWSGLRSVAHPLFRWLPDGSSLCELGSLHALAAGTPKAQTTPRSETKGSIDGCSLSRLTLLSSNNKNQPTSKFNLLPAPGKTSVDTTGFCWRKTKSPPNRDPLTILAGPTNLSQHCSKSR